MSVRWARQFAIGVAAIVVLGLSLMLLSYAQWVREIAHAETALASGDYPAAEQAGAAAYATAEHSLFPLANFHAQSRKMVFNRARALSAMKQDDASLRLLEAAAQRIPALADDPEYHLWVGNALYRQAVAQTEKQALRVGLERAADSFRSGLASAPEDWDLKYNYELTARLLEAIRNQDDKTEKLKRGEMKILREDSDKPKEPQNKLTPAKRS